MTKEQRPVIKGWKQQMMAVTKIGEERALTRPPWKPFKPVEIKVPDGQQESHIPSE